MSSPPELPPLAVSYIPSSPPQKKRPKTQCETPETSAIEFPSTPGFEDLNLDIATQYGPAIADIQSPLAERSKKFTAAFPSPQPAGVRKAAKGSSSDAKMDVILNEIRRLQSCVDSINSKLDFFLAGQNYQQTDNA